MVTSNNQVYEDSVIVSLIIICLSFGFIFIVFANCRNCRGFQT